MIATTDVTARRENGDGDVTAGRENRRTRPRGYVASWRPQAKTQDLLANIDAVLVEYEDHLPLTVRQIFYRLVGSCGYAKTENAYSNLCETMQMARRAHRISFSAIRDDGVITYARDWYADVDAFHLKVQAMAQSYERDKLARQPRHVELWCEAAGMMPQLTRVADDYSVPVYSSGGFDSATSKWELAQRICEVGKPAIILHLGDYDPSGVTIFRAVEEDVRAFVLADRPWATVDVEFVRVALNREQVDSFRLSTAPPKREKNSHANRWTDAQTCQLEALAPDDLADIVRAAIEESIDLELLAADENLERWERRELTLLLPPGGTA
jgi:hypothetical protein